MKVQNLFIAVMSLFLIHCGGGGKSGAKATSTGGVEARGQQLVNEATGEKRAALAKPQASSWGRIYINDKFQWENQPLDSQDTFQQKVTLFLLPQFMDLGGDSGKVDGSEASTQTGIAFWGKGFKVSGQDFVLGQTYPAKTKLDVNSAEFRLSVYTDIEGRVQEVPIHFKGDDQSLGQLEDSYIEGNYVQLVFADHYGKISLTGSVLEGKYEGLVLFRNLYRQEDGSVISQESSEVVVLGRFSVDACGFFSCSK